MSGKNRWQRQVLARDAIHKGTERMTHMIEAKPALRCMRCLYGDSHGYCVYILAMLHRRPCVRGVN